MGPSAPANRIPRGGIASSIVRLVVSIVAVVAVILVIALLDVQPDRLLSAALNLFLAVVLVGSIRWGSRYAILLSLLSALSFSWLLAPAGHFHLSDGRVWTLLTACLVTGLIASWLSGRLRLAALEANERHAEALAEQQRFADLVNSVEGIVWDADATTFAFSFVSNQAERILGYPTQRWLSEPTFWKDHLHPEDRDRAVQFCQQAGAEQRSHDFEYRMMGADGRVVWMRDLVTVVVENGRATRLRGVMVDVTKRKIGEEALREQARLLDLTHDAVLVRDINRTISYWNRGAEELYGWRADEATGRVPYELLNTVFPKPLEEIEAEVLGTGRWEGELVQTKKDGTTVVAASRWALARDENGMPNAILVTNNDITERKRSEQARHEVEELSRAAFESNPTMYFIVDSAGVILNVNTFGAEQLGYTVDELIGQPVLNVFYEADKAAVQEHATACFNQPGQMMRWEARKLCKDGTMIWVRETGNAVFLKKERVLLVVCENITDQKRAEDAASRSEKELRHLIETIPVMVFSIRPDGSTAFASRNWQDFAGLSVEDTTGIGWQATIHPDDLDTHLNKWRDSMAIGQVFENEVRHRSAQGEYRWFLVRAVPLRDEQGNIVKWYGTLTDIEDRKRAEARLRTAMSERVRLSAFRAEIGMVLAHEENLRGTLQKCAEAIVRHLDAAFARVWTLSSDGGELQLQASAGMYTRLDGSHSRIPFGQLKIGLIAQERKPHLTNNAQTDPRVNDQEWARREGMISFAGYPLLVEDRVVGVMGMFAQKALPQNTLEALSFVADAMAQVIDRKRGQEALRRSEAYLAEAQRLSQTGSWAYKPGTTRAFYWSEEMFRIWGFEPTQDPPDNETVWQRIHPEDRQKLNQHLEGARESHLRSEVVEDHRIVLPGGTVKHIHGISHPVFNEAGEVIEYVGTAVDVTERKRAEAEIDRLRQLEADLARINRMSTMGELTASLAHEINQPIAAAVTNANTSVRWLAGEIPNIDEARDAAKRAAKDATRAADIITRIRSLFKKGNLQRELVDLNHVINDVLALLRDEATKWQVGISSELAANVPPLVADRVQLQQVLMNLMVNSIDAMKGVDGPRKLTVSSQYDAEQVLVAVSDSGVGLPAETSRIFDAFFTTKPQGTGMGLAITRSIIESHGGRLWANSNPNGGATLCFTLPVQVEVRV